MFEKRTKIICTIGPASMTVEKLTAMARAGMNVCRLNFSHGTHAQHAELIKRIRIVSHKLKQPLTILQDLQGPKIRVGELPKDGVKLETGKTVVFTTGKGKSSTKLPVTYPDLHADVKAGQVMLLDDGLLSVRVLNVKGKDVTCEVIDGGLLTSHKGINLPETKTSISALSDKDRDDVKFGVQQEVDWIALSFVRSAKDIHELRTLIEKTEKTSRKHQATPIRIIAKIEKPEAVSCLDEIVTAADGIMVARGDLGIETPAAKVPVIQKILIAKCLAASKPVVVATQMLDSMIRNPRATRAEISDVANAVIDHTDATMLSGETASGAYPVEAVRTMAETIHAAENSIFDDLPLSLRMEKDPQLAMTNLASVLARSSHAKAILVASWSGQAARLVSRYRPDLPIYVVTPFERVVRQLCMSWGMKPFLAAPAKNAPELIQHSIAHVLKMGEIKKGDQIIVVAGEPLGGSGNINLVELRRA